MVISIFKIAKRHFQEYIALTIKNKKQKNNYISLLKLLFMKHQMQYYTGKRNRFICISSHFIGSFPIDNTAQMYLMAINIMLDAKLFLGYNFNYCI